MVLSALGVLETALRPVVGRKPRAAAISLQIGFELDSKNHSSATEATGFVRFELKFHTLELITSSSDFGAEIWNRKRKASFR
jgi:hypothetical protein